MIFICLLEKAAGLEKWMASNFDSTAQDGLEMLRHPILGRRKAEVRPDRTGGFGIVTREDGISFGRSDWILYCTSKRLWSLIRLVGESAVAGNGPHRSREPYVALLCTSIVHKVE